jgi:hypothetical protein
MYSDEARITTASPLAWTMKAAPQWRCAVWSASGSPIKQLVGSTPKKKAPAKKPKNYAKLPQKEKFMAAAQEFEAEQTGETFLRNFRAIAKKPTKRSP